MATSALSGDGEGRKIFTVELYRKVRLASTEGLGQRGAARHFDSSGDTVRKMLSISVPPGYRRKAPIKRLKLDGFTKIIDAWLGQDRQVHRKQRHAAKRVIERLRMNSWHGATLRRQRSRPASPSRRQSAHTGRTRTNFRHPICESMGSATWVAMGVLC